ncbi:hypothetical protein B7H18_18365 [Pseudomonas putida]|nr:hypothetical protein B7H18_18365 [Pseudomonas putida]
MYAAWSADVVAFTLWERACPRSRRLGTWHRLRRCSRPRPLPQRLRRLQIMQPVAPKSGKTAG